MGVAAAIAAAGIWAMSAAMMGSQTSRVDAISISAIRAIWAGVFFLVLLFATGENAEIGEMSAWIIVQLVLSALIGLALGDTLYVISIARLGMNRAFTISIGLFAVFSFALSAAVLGESVGVLTIVGAAFVLAGVYLVATYGRAGVPSAVESTHDDAEPKPPVHPRIAGGAELIVDADVAGEPHAPSQPMTARLKEFLFNTKSPGFGLLVLVVAAMLWAIATVWLRDASTGFSAISVGAVRIPAAGAFLGFAVLSQPNASLRRRAVPRRSMSVLTIAGVVGTGVGSLLFIYAVQEAGAGKTAVLSSISPIFALPLSVIFLGEKITRWLLLGTALAVVGIILLA
jgi:drug/metabolite transporter (DMT)-like permease